MTEPDYKYCRREKDGKPCGQKIERKNAMNYCGECRKAHLPFWPVDSEGKSEYNVRHGKG